MHFTVRRAWVKSFHLQLLQECYCENSGSPTSASVMRHCYFIKCMQSLRAINGLLAVGQVGNLLCGRLSYVLYYKQINMEGAQSSTYLRLNRASSGPRMSVAKTYSGEMKRK